MCIFVENWDCNFAGQEITLDICKTCIDAKRLYNETKHDRALQERKKRMEEMSKGNEPDSSIVPEREKQKEKSKKKPKEKAEERPTRETTEVSPKIEEKSPLEAIEDEIYSEKIEEKGLIESLEEENESLEEESPGEKVKDQSSLERLEPSSIIEMENLQGSVEDIRNDPTKPTDGWLTTISEGEVSALKAEFPNPPDKLQTGENKQEFLVRVRRTDEGGSFYPEINVMVCEDGEIITETGRREIKDVHGEVVSLKWNAGTLIDLYGTDVEIIVEGLGKGEGDTLNHIEIGAVEWRANLIEAKTKRGKSEEQNLEEKLLSSIEDESGDETIDAIKSDLNPLE